MTVDFEVLSSMIADNDNSFDIEGRVKDFESVTIVYGIIKVLIPLHEKFLQFDWLRAVVFQLNLKYLHVKITKPLQVVV